MESTTSSASEENESRVAKSTSELEMRNSTSFEPISEMIALQYGITVEKLIDTNQLISSELAIGQELLITVE